MTYSQWCLDNLNYETQTTFFEDFSIAERFGINAIKDTFKRAMLHHSNYKMMTELCMVLNHKIWFTYETKPTIAKLYNELWDKCREWCYSNLKGDELQYFLRTTDQSKTMKGETPFFLF